MVLAGVAALVQTELTFSAPAEPASRLLPELGKAAGVKMEAAPAIAREVLVIGVKNAPLAELMKRIAQAASGEWEERDGVYRLALNGATDAKERRAEVAERGEVLSRAIAQRMESRRQGRYSDGGPGLFESMIGGLPAQTLGSLGFKERVVFSTSPTAMQRPLPQTALRNVDLTKLPKVEGPTMDGVAAPPPGPAAVVQLAIQPSSDGSMLMGSLVVADTNGRVVGATSGSLYIGGIVRPTGALPKLKLPDAAIKPSERERSRAVALASLDGSYHMAGGMDEENVAGGTRAMYTEADLSGTPASRQIAEILQPETTEPLSLTAGPLLARLAEAEGQNLVAVLPDRALVPARALLATSGETAGGVAQAAASMGIDLADDGGWIVARPLRPWSARAARLDRAALGFALRTLVKDGTLSLDAQATYAAAQPMVAPADTFEGGFFGAVNPSYGKRMAATCTGGERLVLRLYHAMGPPKPGEPRTFGSLPALGQAALRSMVFDSLEGPDRVFTYRGARSQGSVTYSGGPFMSPWTLDMERTVYWRDGIPRNMPVQEFESTYPVTFGLAPDGARPKMSEGLAGFSVTQNGNTPAVVATSLPHLAQYAWGTVRRVVFQLSGPPGVNFSRSLEEERIDSSRAPIAYGDLPESLRSSIERLEESARKSAEYSQPRRNSAKP